LTDSSYLW